MNPTRVPRLCEAIPTIGGTFGAEPEDFVVEERLAYEPAGDGSHLFLWIEKRDLTTLEAVRRLARFLGRDPEEFGLAGLKDRRAVARQWISIEHEEPERLRGWTIGGVAVRRAERHPHKLRLGHGLGNRFEARLRGVGAGGRARSLSIAAEIAQRGIPNAYGSQRFGRGGSSLEAGLALLRRDEAAFARAAGRPPGRIERRLLSLFLSAAQSEAFNRVLARRMPAIGAVRAGDVATIHASGASFVVEDEGRESARAARFEISPSGPIPGTRLLQGHGEPRALEDAVLAELALEPARFAGLPLGLEAKGARRALRAPVEGLSVEEAGEDLLLRFALPSGSFATRVVEEFLGPLDSWESE